MKRQARQRDVSATPQDPRALVIGEPLAPTLLRLFIWLIVVTGFYAVTLRAISLKDGGWQSADIKDWLLLLFPLFLLPYLVGCIRSLTGAGKLTFDGKTRKLFKRDRQLAAFEDISQLRWIAVNGTCEEVRLSAVLNDGRSIRLYEGGQMAAISRLAEDIADLVGVEIYRTT